MLCFCDHTMKHTIKMNNENYYMSFRDVISYLIVLLTEPLKLYYAILLFMVNNITHQLHAYA